MAKKYIPIIAGIIAVVAIIVIAIIGSNPDLRNRDIYVNSITVTTEHNGTIKDNNEEIKYFYMTGDNTNIVDGRVTFKLDYTVSPANATQKTVKFTSSNTEVATVDENGLVTFIRNEAVFITLTAKDERAVTTRVQLVWPAEVDSGMTVGLDDNNNITFTNVGASQFFNFEGNTLTLYSGMNYAFDTDAVITLSDSTSADFENGALTTSGVGTFTLTFVFGTGDTAVTKEVNVEVVEYINNFQMGTSYSAYLNTVANLGSDSVALNFLNTEAMPYEVGAGNAFHFDISVQNQDMESVSLANAHLVYTVYEVIDGENSLVADNSTVFTVNEDGTLQFKPETVGKSYQVSVVPEYNFLNRQPITFNFKVVEGVNVYTHSELKTNFAKLDVNNIILHSTIVAEVEENQLDPDGRLINFDALTANNGVTGDIYTRLYTEETLVSHADDLSITISGNYFSIDASDIPYLTVLGNGSGYSNYDPLEWTENSGYPCASVQTAIFKVQENTADAYNTGVEKTNVVNFNINNLRLEGNTSTGILYDEDYPVDDDGNPIVPDDEAAIIADQGSSSAGFMGRGAVKINTNNVVILKTNIGVYVTGSCGGAKTDYTLINDSWAIGVFGWRTTGLELRNTTISRAGGAAVNVTDATITDAYSPAWMDATITFGPNVIVDNYVAGTEGYFIVNGMASVATKLKADLNPRIQAMNKTVLKQETASDGTGNYSVFNFVIQFGRENNNYKLTDHVIHNVGAEDGWQTYVSGMYLERQGEYLVNVNNSNERYAITGTTCTINKTVDSQITLKFFTGYNGEEEQYAVHERKSGYFDNNPVVNAFEGIGLSGVGSVNISDAILMAGLVAGYIQDENFDAYITTGGTPSEGTAAYLVENEDKFATTINGVEGLDVTITSIKAKIIEKIENLGNGNLTNGLGVFATTLSDIEKVLYLCDQEMLTLITTNLATYNSLIEDPRLSDVPGAAQLLQGLVAGFEQVRTAASADTTAVSAAVAISCNVGTYNIKEDKETDLELLEVKINSSLMGDFSGILIYAGLFDIA